MSKDLYFIRLLSEAVSQPNARSEIRRALDRIIHLGQDQGYERGYTQFLQFMEKMFETSESEIPWLIRIWENLPGGAVLKINVAKD